VVTVARPVSYPVQSYYEYNGYLESVHTVQVKAEVKGILTKVHFTEGDDIGVGEMLYTIDPREYEAAVSRAQAQIEKAEADSNNADAQIKLAQADLERQEKAGASVSAAELDKALASVASNKALLKIAQANKNSAIAAKRTSKLDLDKSSITAEIAGRIGRTQVKEGNLVGQNETTLLTTIVQMDKLYVNFDAPERDLVEKLRLATDTTKKPNLLVQIGVSTEIGFPHSGTIDFWDNQVNTGTGTIRVRGNLDNPLGPDGKQYLLYPGLYARVRVPAGPIQDRLVIPEEAIMTGQEGTYVYIVGEGNVVAKRTVSVVAGPPVWRTQPIDSSSKAGPGWVMANAKAPPNTPDTPLRSMVAIERGLEATDVVIINGLQKARPGSPINPEEWTIRAPAIPKK